MSKTAYLVVCLLAGFVVESLFQINVYVLTALMVWLFACIWHMDDQRKGLIAQREQRELQVQVQSTAKDAHLKLKQLVTMVSSIPSPMMLLDQFGKVVLHNDVSSLLHGTLKEEEEITYLQNPFPYEIQEFIKDSYILEKHFERMIQVDLMEYQALSVPVISQGKFSGCLILFQDITKALEGEKMQKRFLADASHELKTPIAIIKGMVEILNREDFDDPTTQAEFLKDIDREIKRLDELVKDILTLSKLSNHHPILDRHRIDMNALIQGSIQSLQKSAQQKGLTLHYVSACDDLIFCDEMKMLQVLTNLISNAIKYSDDGDIEVRFSKQDAKVVIEVEDHGSGLSEEQKAKIFERFYRVDDDRSRKSGGSGLGLAIVKSIVEAHGGQIEIDSTPGVGSIFRVSLKN